MATAAAETLTEGGAVSTRRAAAVAQEAVRQKPANWGDMNKNQRKHWKMRKGASLWNLGKWASDLGGT